MDRSAVHISVLRARHREHLPCQLCHCVQHCLPSLLICYHLHRDTAPPPHLPDVRQVRRLHPQIQLQLHARRDILCHERRAVDQHLAHGDQSDRCSYFPLDCIVILRPCWLQGPAIPRQQNTGWSGCCADDHISRASKVEREPGTMWEEEKNQLYDSRT